jgi:hypothetical protein
VTDQDDTTTPEPDEAAPVLPYRLTLVHNGQRTPVAAFSSPWLAVVAADLFTLIPSRPDLERDGYEVEGIRVEEDPHPQELEAVSRELLSTIVLPGTLPAIEGGEPE